MNLRARLAPLALTVSLFALTGCPIRFPEELNIEVNKGDEVVIEAPANFDSADFVLVPDATVVTDVAAIPVDVVPDLTLLTFENFTGNDLVISYFVEGSPETVLVPFDQVVSIEYDPCLADVQLDFEDDFDPDSGTYLGSFDLSGVVLIEGDDFLCGDEIFFTFDPEAVAVTAQPL